MADSPSEYYVPVTTLPTISEKVVYDTSAHVPFVGSKIDADIKPAIAVSTTIGKKSDYVVISVDSGRTIENPKIGKKAVWSGELPGDIYGDQDEKGSRFEGLFRIQYNESRHEWRVQGLLPYIPQVISREEESSETLRRIGLPTDVTRSVYVIKELPDTKGKYFPIQSFKVHGLERLKKELEKDPKKEEKMASANKYLNNLSFCIEKRDLQVSERLRDVSKIQTQEQFDKMIDPIFKWVNVATAYRKSGLISGTSQPDRFEYTESGIERYFYEWLPGQIGIYMGRLRVNHIVHRNVNAQNFSAVATLYDKDTLVCAQNVNSSTILPFGRDLISALGTLDELLNPENGNYLSRKYNHEHLLTAKTTFLKSYLEEMSTSPTLKGSFIVKNRLDNYTYWDGHNNIKVGISKSDWKFMEELGLKTK